MAAGGRFDAKGGQAVRGIPFSLDTAPDDGDLNITLVVIGCRRTVDKKLQGIGHILGCHSGAAGAVLIHIDHGRKHPVVPILFNIQAAGYLSKRGHQLLGLLLQHVYAGAAEPDFQQAGFSASQPHGLNPAAHIGEIIQHV